MLTFAGGHCFYSRMKPSDLRRGVAGEIHLLVLGPAPCRVRSWVGWCMPTVLVSVKLQLDRIVNYLGDRPLGGLFCLHSWMWEEDPS